VSAAVAVAFACSVALAIQLVLEGRVVGAWLALLAAAAFLVAGHLSRRAPR
jgi:hypothetical protein